jgi:H+-transporting ATPase
VTPVAENAQTNSGSKGDPKPDTNGKAKLQSSPKGLTQAEAAKRLINDGPNALKVEKSNAFLKFLTYFWGPIPWMIEAAVILSGVVRHWLDFFIILALLFSNAVVAFWEEHQAGNEIAALKAKLANDAKVLRDGKWAAPKASELARRHCSGRRAAVGWRSS